MNDAVIDIGKIVAAHGLKGEVKVLLYLENPQKLKDYPLQLKDGRNVSLLSLRGHEEPYIAHFSEIDSRASAEALKGQTLLTKRSALPPRTDEAYYLADLIGLKLIDGAGNALGRVLSFHDYGAGVILECSIGTRTELLPFKAGFFGGVDTAAGSLELLWTPTPDPVRKRTSKTPKNNV